MQVPFPFHQADAEPFWPLWLLTLPLPARTVEGTHILVYQKAGARRDTTLVALAPIGQFRRDC